MAKSQDKETLGARLARLRREKELTQAELAQRLQGSQPAVSDYESDVIRLPADVVVTGDNDLLDLNAYQNIRSLPPPRRCALRRIERQRQPDLLLVALPMLRLCASAKRAERSD